MKWNRTSVSLVIFMTSLLLFVPFLGGSQLFDWDEVNFAEAAREMLVTGEFSYVQINFKPFWEKPPLFIWMQAASMLLFGVNEFAARFPNAICGAITLVLLFQIGSKLISTRFGLLWVLIYAGSMLPQFYFRSGIIDPWFNLFIFFGIHLLVLATEQEKLLRGKLALSAFVVGLAVMTKGPTAFGLVTICAAAYFVISYKKHQWRILDFITYTFIVFATGFSWFLLEILRGHGYVIQEAIDYHIRLFSSSEAGHGQPFFYHPLVLLFGCFPMSLFFFFSFGKKLKTDNQVAHYKKWMTILFWVVLIVFSIVKTKIIHYSSLTYFPMSFIATLFIFQMQENKLEFKKRHQIVLMVFTALFAIAFFVAGTLNLFQEQLLMLMKENTLAYGNFSQDIEDSWFDPLFGLFFLIGASFSVYHINKSEKAVLGLFATTLIAVTVLSATIAPKIDRYTQKPLFDFYKEHADLSYLKPIAFHSYAHLFYGKRTPLPVQTDDELKWMVYEKVDKPVYFIARAENVERTLGYFPHLKVTGRKGGYVILERTDGNYPFLGSR